MLFLVISCWLFHNIVRIILCFCWRLVNPHSMLIGRSTIPTSARSQTFPLLLLSNIFPSTFFSRHDLGHWLLYHLPYHCHLNLLSTPDRTTVTYNCVVGLLPFSKNNLASSQLDPFIIRMHNRINHITIVSE